jgi:hypothetical protein
MIQDTIVNLLFCSMNFQDQTQPRVKEENLRDNLTS